MQIHDVMSTGVVTGQPMDTVRDVVVKMLSRHCGAIPIVNASHELLRIVRSAVMLPMYLNYGDYMHGSVHSRAFLDMEGTIPKSWKRRPRRSWCAIR